MNKDLLKTIGGILIIGAIVVATFLYGNQQRQEQVRRDQAQTQEQSEQEPAKPEVVVQQPTPGAPTSNGQTQPATTPETGGELAVIIPLGMLVLFERWHRASKLGLRTAALR